MSDFDVKNAKADNFLPMVSRYFLVIMIAFFLFKFPKQFSWGEPLYKICLILSLEMIAFQRWINQYLSEYHAYLFEFWACKP